MNIKMQLPHSISKKKIYLLILIIIITCCISSCNKNTNICGIYVSYENTKAHNSDIENSIENAFLLLPEHFQEKIKDDGFKIVITDTSIAEKFMGQVPAGTLALTDLNTKTIYIESDEPSYILHELCHACCYNKYTNSSFYIKYEGCDEEMHNSNLDSYYTENYDEYIVESMSRYLENNTSLDAFPVTKFTVEEMIKSTEWIYENGE